MHPYLAEFIDTFVLVFCDCSSALLDTDYLGTLAATCPLASSPWQ
jgi:hypothetical protein